MATPPQEVESELAANTSPAAGDYRDFSAAWPQVFRATVHVLVGRGVHRSTAEDAAQEAGARAWTSGVPYADADDLTRWVSTVAWRIAIDEHRRHGRRITPVAVPERPAEDDVVRSAEARLDLRSAVRAWPSLSASDRAALVGGSTAAAEAGVSDRRGAVRSAVRRHRARSRLVALMEALGGVVVAVLARGRRPATVAAFAAMPLAAVILVHPGGGPGPSHPHATQQPQVSAAVLSPVSATRAGVETARPSDRPAPVGATHAPRDAGPRDVEPPRLPLVDPGVTADLRPRDSADDVVCVRLPTVPESCVPSTGSEIELSRLDDPVEHVSLLP